MIVDLLKNNRERIISIFYILMPLAFFCSVRIFNFIIFSSAGLTLIYLFIDFKLVKERNRKAILLLLIPFLLILYTLIQDIFHNDAAGGWYFFETYLPLGFFPLMIAVIGITDQQIRLTKASFFTGCIIAALLCLGFAFWKNITDHDRIVHNWSFAETMKFYEDHPIGAINWGFFLYMEFANAVHFHPTYLSIFFITGIIFGLSFLERSRRINLLLITGISLLTIEVFLLSSKISLIILLIIFALAAIRIIYRATRHTRYVVIATIAAITIALAVSSPVAFYRIEAIIKDLQSSNSNADMASSNLHRLQLWKNAVELFKERPLTGWGLSGAEKALQAATHQTGSQRFNTHNQYLMLLISGGLLGIIFFLAAYSTYIISSIRAADYIYTVFLITILLGLLTENLLSRHAGVVLYSFFNALFFIHLHNRKNEKI
ncbi:O-antigen ligase family protein [Ohtaekwangia sp.]|uniref:O-antigen ligase family protein n=1 Tax=Ohtaekwangia sp. TaxID=2066019 RepID=UPI002FDEC77B